MRFRLLAVGLATALLGGCNKQPEVAAKLDTPRPFDLKRIDGARIQGSPNAKIWLIVASDFQCPFCRMFHADAYKQILRDYVAPGKVRMAFLNQANPSHVHARQAAEAAMCAGAQDRFWQMHDALFTTQERWAPTPDATPVFDSLAVSLSLSMDDWRRCVSTHATRDMIDSDRARAQDGGSGSTPTFFINQRIAIVGAEPYAVFKRALDSALAAAGPASGAK